MSYLGPEVDGMIVACAVIIPVFVVYFVPSIVAASWHHPNVASIMIINLLAGWTVLAWVITLAWAFSGVARGPCPSAGVPARGSLGSQSGSQF